jgi:hypothetical protein
MSEQNFKNHSRWIPLWHFIAPLVLLAVIIGSIVNLWNAEPGNKYSAALIVVLAFLMIIPWVYGRLFALRAQDRAIRAEENFRHYLLTGKPHDSRLRMRQIIALRFASDGEMPALATKAAEEKLSAREIKTMIVNWRPDYYRV